MCINILSMKKAFSRWYNYIIALAIVIVIACVAVIPYFALNDAAKWPLQYIFYVFMFSGIVVFGVGFIIQDVYRAKIRHKTKNWNNPLPDTNIETAWKIFCPLFLGGLSSLVVGLIWYFISLLISK